MIEHILHISSLNYLRCATLLPLQTGVEIEHSMEKETGSTVD